MKAKISLSLLGLCAYALILPVAEAHTIGVYNAGLAAGLTHPFLGLDHLLAMIAVGIWAGQLGGKSVWLVPGHLCERHVCRCCIGFFRNHATHGGTCDCLFRFSLGLTHRRFGALANCRKRRHRGTVRSVSWLCAWA